MTTALVSLIVALVLTYVLLAFVMIEGRRERMRLINRLIAKTPSEVRVLDNEPRRSDPPPRPPVDEDAFWANFEGQVGG